MAYVQVQNPPAGATGDAAIIAAHDRRARAFAAIADLAMQHPSKMNCVLADELSLLREINVAEELLGTTIATTAAGAHAQLKAGLYHINPSAEIDAALTAQSDWTPQLIAAGLRSLEQMEVAYGE